MMVTICRYCGSSDVKSKEIEIRRVNAYTMTIASRQMVTELECRLCGWVGSPEGLVVSR
jgi:hypothetical protein